MSASAPFVSSLETTPAPRTTKLRNTASLIEHATPSFAAAHEQGVMAVYGRSTQGRCVVLAERDAAPKQIVDFVRCSYLGLDNHPAIVRGAVEAIEEYGAVHWSCARTRLNFSLIGDLEADLSDLFRTRVITYSTVLAANMGALPLLASGHLTGGSKPVVVFDRFAHATLAFHKAIVAEETAVLTIGHNDLTALENICRKHPCVAYVCDGVYSMGGTAPITDLLALQERYGLFLYIDDAHGVSLFGDQGEGFARSQIDGALGDRTIVAASLGKGFGASGGLLMLGSELQEHLFRYFSVAHAFSASPNLAAVGAALASAKLHRTPELAERRAALAERIAAFDALVDSQQKGAPLPIRTVLIGSEAAAIQSARELLDAGIYVSAIFFPTVARGRAGLRLCPTAAHTAAQITEVGHKLNSVLERHRSPAAA